MKKRKSHHTSSFMMMLLTCVVAINSIGLAVLRGWGSIAPFFYRTVSFVATLIATIRTFVLTHARPLLFALFCIVMAGATLYVCTVAKVLPYPRTAAEVLTRTHISIYDKHGTPLYEVRDEGQYNALMRSSGQENSSDQTVSSVAASRVVAATQLALQPDDLSWLLKKEISAARVRARFSGPQIMSLYRTVLPSSTSPTRYSRAPLSTSFALTESSRILGKKRFDAGGFMIYTTIDLLLYNERQQQLLTEVAQGALPNGEIIVAYAQDGSIASLNTRQLPTAHMQSSDFDPSIHVVTSIVATDGRILYQNRQLINKNVRTPSFVSQHAGLWRARGGDL